MSFSAWGLGGILFGDGENRKKPKIFQGNYVGVFVLYVDV